MTKTFKLALPLTFAILAGAVAHGSSDEAYGQIDAATRTQISETLAANGYELRKVEADDGRYEAYALKDGVRYEIYLDREFKIIKTERDDD